MVNHPRAFRNFLERAEDEGWIAGYRWIDKDSFVLLREELKKSSYEDGSKTLKKAPDGTWWGLDVDAHSGSRVGVEMQLLLDRKILKSADWMAARFGISRSLTNTQMLEEWCTRQACFKALRPDFPNLMLTELRKTSTNSYSVFGKEAELSVQTRLIWWEKWILAMAWRSASPSFLL